MNADNWTANQLERIAQRPPMPLNIIDRLLP